MIEDHMMAFRVQKMLNIGQEICKDAELAHEAQERLDQLLVQVESNREYAESLAGRRERAAIRTRQQSESQQGDGSDTISQADSRISSLFGLCVQICSDNKVNVAEAFLTGKVKSIVNLTQQLSVTKKVVMMKIKTARSQQQYI